MNGEQFLPICPFNHCTFDASMAAFLTLRTSVASLMDKTSARPPEASTSDRPESGAPNT